MPQSFGSGVRGTMAQYLWRTLRGVHGRVLGTIVDILGDADNGAPQWLVIRVRGLPPRHRAAPISLCVESRGHLVMPTSRRTLREGPPVRPGDSLSARQELALRVHWFTT